MMLENPFKKLLLTTTPVVKKSTLFGSGRCYATIAQV
jgi:hypothetical protein